MVFYILAFLIGASCLILLSHLPPFWVGWVLLLNGLLWPIRLLRLLIAAVLGFAWALLSAQQLMAWTLPADLEGKKIVITGIINTIPEFKNNNLSFEFDVEKGIQPARVRLSWYHGPNQLRVGDRWQLTVRLKRPRGFWNAESFDYQAWLLEHHVRATGYVIANGDNHLISSNRFEHIINRIREHLAQKITEILSGKPLVGLVSALAVGVRDSITEEQWSVLRGTGTNHLFAIAGLHIGFVSGLIYFLVSFIWRRLGRLPLYIATPQAAAFGALIAAVIYSALAGFAMPTQRAIIMIAVFLLATLLRKNLPPWTAWSLALLIVLIIEPLAILSDSFWLSFGAVALIIYGVGGRLKQSWHWGRIQWVIAVGLIPLSLLFFHQTSLGGFIANAIAIPWVGFIVLPLSLLGNLFGAPFWYLAEWTLEIIWPVLVYIAAVDVIQWNAYLTNPWILFTSLIAVVLLLAPKGLPIRWLGFIWALPLLVWVPAGPAAGEVWLTYLDVGRGLAVIIRTAQHTLVYDTGPGFNSGFDAGEAVIIPTLRAAGINKIDTLIISSANNNHIGGARVVLKQMSVTQVITSVPLFFQPGLARVCQANEYWEWDKISFRILDADCRLQIDNSMTIEGDMKVATAQEGTIIYRLSPGKEPVIETYYGKHRHFWEA